jgi:hypothetical protein
MPIKKTACAMMCYITVAVATSGGTGTFTMPTYPDRNRPRVYDTLPPDYITATMICVNSHTHIGTPSSGHCPKGSFPLLNGPSNPIIVNPLIHEDLTR